MGGAQRPGDRRPCVVTGARPVLVTGGAGFLGANLADRLAGAGRQVLVLDSLARPGVEANLEWLKSRHKGKVAALLADVRDADAVREAVRRGGCRPPPRRPGGGDDQPRGPGRRLRGQRPRHAQPARGRPARGALAAARSSPRPTRSTASSCPTRTLERRGDRWEPRDADLRGGRAASHAARLLQPLRLLQGRRRPVRPRLRPLLRPAHAGLPHELPLRAAPVRHRGPGLGRPLPHQGAAGRAGHHLRRRRPGAGRALRRRRGRRLARRPGADRPAARAAPSTSAAGPPAR